MKKFFRRFLYLAGFFILLSLITYSYVKFTAHTEYNNKVLDFKETGEYIQWGACMGEKMPTFTCATYEEIDQIIYYDTLSDAWFPIMRRINPGMEYGCSVTTWYKLCD